MIVSLDLRDGDENNSRTVVSSSTIFGISGAIELTSKLQVEEAGVENQHDMIMDKDVQPDLHMLSVVITCSHSRYYGELALIREIQQSRARVTRQTVKSEKVILAKDVHYKRKLHQKFNTRRS